VRRPLIVVLVLVVLAAAAVIAAVLSFRGDGDKASEEPIRVTPASGSIGLFGTAGSTAQPLARLPGITVIGSGEIEVKPDTALVRLTVGTGSAFQGSDGNVELIDEEDLEPVVNALADAGAPKDDIYVNTFAGSFGSNEGAAVIILKWPRPQDVKEILSTAQRSVRKETNYNLQAIAVAFMREDCDGPEEKAMRDALADARKRAERLAALSDAKLGRLIAVSEATASDPLSALTTQRCGVAELLAPGLFEYQSGSATAEEITVTSTLEVTFAVEQ
jgi:uncharacterized protein YggE